MGDSRPVPAAVRGCLAIVLSAAAVLAPPTRLTAAEAPRSTVRVRIYQTADLPFPLERALAEAERVLRVAFVDVRWRRCGVWSSAAACTDLLEASELVLRIAPEGTPRRPRPFTLGEALVSPCTGGVLATVYTDRVAALAAEVDTDVAVLMGRVAAHELGHLMMHSSVHHARSGLMRPNWTRQEVQRNLAADWMFTAEDVAAIRR